MLRKSLLALLLLLGGSGPLVAMPVSGLYEASVPVADQSDEERRQALPRAMSQLLIKLTGDPAIAGRAEVKPLINDAARYMQQYGYVERERDADEGTAEPDAETLWLRVAFDPRAVDQSLQQAGIPVWGRERPGTLVWLAVEDEAGLRLVVPEQGDRYLQPLSREAARRGLPLLLPLMDLEDTASLKPEDVREGRAGALREASARYPADVILALYLGVGGGEVSARWTVLSEQAGSDGWTDRGEIVAAVLQRGIDRLADRLAQHYAPASIAGGEPARVAVTVSAVESLSDFARVQNYLAGLGNVRSVTVKEVRPGEVVFEVESLNGATGLDQTIAVGNILRAEAGGSGDRRAYRLLP